MIRHALALRASPSNRYLGIALLRIAAVYLLIGLSMGLGMGMASDFSLSSVHAHISLLGWAAMSITGMVYILIPGCRASKLAVAHFCGHNIGLPVMMAGLVLLTLGVKGAEKAVAGGSTLVILSLVAFTINLFRNGGREPAPGHVAAGAGLDRYFERISFR